jgi:hypothetical protein
VDLGQYGMVGEWFAQIDDKTVRKQLRHGEKNHERIPPEVKSIVKQADLPERMSILFLAACKINVHRHLRQ